ncbi:hypothetical protein G4B88_030863 [Cannabis sativa]|uniref:Zinc knuckle CX2CX4HX4C domain-containing protein n=1 Tax=Cannabis sativa TaxID=3483 RepID=A0A7J6FPK3_CANSA|nr:hypothetical protein G4B88_030863 [Cannabis sativa]
MRMKKTGGEWFYANFKYEHVPTFYFICSIIGHSENFCHKLFDTLAEEIYLHMGTEANEHFLARQDGDFDVCDDLAKYSTLYMSHSLYVTRPLKSPV